MRGNNKPKPSPRSPKPSPRSPRASRSLGRKSPELKSYARVSRVSRVSVSRFTFGDSPRNPPHMSPGKSRGFFQKTRRSSRISLRGSPRPSLRSSSPQYSRGSRASRNSPRASSMIRRRHQANSRADSRINHNQYTLAAISHMTRPLEPLVIVVEKLQVLSYLSFWLMVFAGIVLTYGLSGINIKETLLVQAFGYNNICVYFDYPPASSILPVFFAVTMLLFLAWLFTFWLRMRAEVRRGKLTPRLYRYLTLAKMFEGTTIIIFSIIFAVTPEGWDETLWIHTSPFILLQLGLVSMAVSSTVHGVYGGYWERLGLPEWGFKANMVYIALFVCIVTYKIPAQINGMSKQIWWKHTPTRNLISKIVDKIFMLIAAVVPIIKALGMIYLRSDKLDVVVIYCSTVPQIKREITRISEENNDEDDPLLASNYFNEDIKAMMVPMIKLDDTLRSVRSVRSVRSQETTPQLRPLPAPTVAKNNNSKPFGKATAEVEAFLLDGGSSHQMHSRSRNISQGTAIMSTPTGSDFRNESFFLNSITGSKKSDDDAA